MVPTVNDLIKGLFSWAPAELAEEWDNVGLQVGYPFWPVKKALVVLDVTPATLAYALEVGADIVISHHPLIFSPLKRLDLSEATARLLAGFLRHEISVISMHTNLDSVKGGVNDRLAKLLGIGDTEPLVPSSGDKDAGLGRIGMLEKAVPMEQFLANISTALGRSCLITAGAVQRTIRKVAICSGSGSTLFHEAVKRGAEAFVSAEIKHSIARQAEAQGILVVDAGHFETERPVVHDVKAFLDAKTQEHGWELETVIFDSEKSPLRFWQY